MAPDVSPDDAEVIVPDQEWRHRERTNMLAALKRTKGRISGVGGAAALLGVKPSTLSSRLKSLGIQAEDAH
jgi:transcriptional regulator with GAF, ATPase, and Fis domain